MAGYRRATVQNGPANPHPVPLVFCSIQFEFGRPRCWVGGRVFSAVRLELARLRAELEAVSSSRADMSSASGVVVADDDFPIPQPDMLLWEAEDDTASKTLPLPGVFHRLRG